MRLYHPELKKTIDVPDDDDTAATLAKSGWGKTIPAEHTDSAVAADQPDVTYRAVNSSSVPPKGGPGSGRDEWAAYAATQGLDVTDDMTREEIIEAVEEFTD